MSDLRAFTAHLRRDPENESWFRSDDSQMAVTLPSDVDAEFNWPTDLVVEVKVGTLNASYQDQEPTP